MRTPTPIPTGPFGGPRPKRWQTLLLGTAAALAFAVGGTGSAQDATPPAAECVPTEGGHGCLPIAPPSARIDLEEPTFSNPTAITNPLFPIGDQTRLIQLGVDGGETLRAEASLMPETTSIAWNGGEIEAVVSQFVAYGDGRILEVAYDFYAQDDAGNVWYFGEDVFNYEDGVVVDTDGTWLAGRDGPPGMIAPANPRVGDVYRPENIPGFVFEEVTVVATGVTVNGPRGPVTGAIETRELLADGSLETKHFAPGYGEFSALGGTEYVTVALGLPADASPGTMPAELTTLASISATIFDAATTEDWDAIGANAALLGTIWEVLQAGDVPPVLALQMDSAIEAIEASVEDENPQETGQAALNVARATLDLRLPYVGLPQGDLDELRVWTEQLAHDAAANDRGGVAGDAAAIETVWARVDAAIDAGLGDRVGVLLTGLRTAVGGGDLVTASDLAARLDALLADAAVSA